jgi:hypothetical protein
MNERLFSISKNTGHQRRNRIVSMTHDKPSTRPRGKRRSRSEQQLRAAMLRLLRAGGDLRSRKTRRLRAAIRVNGYENDLKLQIALERLLGELRS